MKTVILCGGRGTRLREETEYRPKPMIPIGGRPILWHIMKLYAAHGLDEFVLCLGYKGDMIRDYFLHYDMFRNDTTLTLGSLTLEQHNGVDHDETGWKITLAETGLETMTGGRLKRIRRYVGERTFMLTYGDGLGNVDVSSLAEFHRREGKLVTVTAVRPVARFGELTVDGSLAAGFAEKPQVESGWINGGFFVCEPGVFEYLSGDDCVFESGPLEQLARERQLAVFKHEGYWQCMDTVREMQQLNREWESGEAPWKIWTT